MRKLEHRVLLEITKVGDERAQGTFGSVSVRSIETVLLNTWFAFVLPGVYV